MRRGVEKDARCSRCDEVVGVVVTEGGRATIRLSTASHGDALPITCPRVASAGEQSCMTKPPGYRCCAHCADDPVHEVERDGHEVPCNAPNSQGCIGRTPVTSPGVTDA